jgi:ABC-type polysaccharide/polyol phosphate transport system ATPase subunit
MINHEHQPYLSLRDKITNIFKPSAPKEEFWALKDVSFNIYPGESVGIIGKNGAGKSTLLKILSKITPPTSGKIISRGRIASLLEVGTGFHPELTGRENIYMNGSILGMRRKEIQKNFDAIVDFAGVEKFIDTPLKHYSSGMQLRLAFAVAAFLEAEILVIDEVLAVGDAEFQKKCLGKMEEVSKQQGRTVLFVSHNINFINHICLQCILLENGIFMEKNTTPKIINRYLNDSLISPSKQNIPFKINAYFENGRTWDSDTNLIIEIYWKKNFFEPGWECDLACYTLERFKVFAIQSNLIKNFDSSNPEFNCIEFKIRNCNLANRRYFFDVGFRKNKNEPYYLIYENCLSIDVTNIKLPIYNRADVIVVPDIDIKLKNH